MLDEPFYEYVRGQGWVILNGPIILTPEQCDAKHGAWLPLAAEAHPTYFKDYLYPPVCKDREIITSTVAIVGDVIPWSFPGGHIKVLVSLNPHVTLQIFPDGRSAELDNYLVGSIFSAVARRRT